MKLLEGHHGDTVRSPDWTHSKPIHTSGHVLWGIKMVFKVSVEVGQSPQDMYCTNVVMNGEVEGNVRNVDGFLHCWHHKQSEWRPQFCQILTVFGFYPELIILMMDDRYRGYCPHGHLLRTNSYSVICNCLQCWGCFILLNIIKNYEQNGFRFRMFQKHLNCFMKFALIIV